MLWRPLKHAGPNIHNYSPLLEPRLPSHTGPSNFESCRNTWSVQDVTSPVYHELQSQNRRKLELNRAWTTRLSEREGCHRRSDTLHTPGLSPCYSPLFLHPQCAPYSKPHLYWILCLPLRQCIQQLHQIARDKMSGCHICARTLKARHCGGKTSSEYRRPNEYPNQRWAPFSHFHCLKPFMLQLRCC